MPQCPEWILDEEGFTAEQLNDMSGVCLVAYGKMEREAGNRDDTSPFYGTKDCIGQCALARLRGSDE